MPWDGIDKRRFPRANYPCLIKIAGRKPYFSVATRTENIGCGGICVILGNDLGRFTSVELELTLPNGQPSVQSAGRTVWVVKGHYPGKKQPKRYDTGIEFVDLNEDYRKRIDHIIDEILAGKIKPSV